MPRHGVDVCHESTHAKGKQDVVISLTVELDSKTHKRRAEFHSVDLGARMSWGCSWTASWMYACISIGEHGNKNLQDNRHERIVVAKSDLDILLLWSVSMRRKASVTLLPYVKARNADDWGALGSTSRVGLVCFA